MVTWLFSPWGIPASYREMHGSGANTSKWVNAAGEAMLVKYHWDPKQGERNLTQAEAIQAKNFNHATQDLYDAIERGDYPEWELQVQIMSDDEHPELDFDPLDDTKLWPTDQFPMRPVGRMVLNRNPQNYFAEVEQAAFGTGVLVDGLDFSDDKMLQGRTFSYSDTQRYRVGANYLQLPINRPKTHVATNQQGARWPTRSIPSKQAPTPMSITSQAVGRAARGAQDGAPSPALRRRAGWAPTAQPAEQLPAGRRALPYVRGLGARGAHPEPGHSPQGVQPRHPGADGLALQPVRPRVRPARGRWTGDRCRSRPAGG